MFHASCALADRIKTSAIPMSRQDRFLLWNAITTLVESLNPDDSTEDFLAELVTILQRFFDLTEK